MQNEKIEQDFFETFGIEKKEPCKYGLGCGHIKPCCPRKLTYPPITPEIVLKLAATLNDIVFSKIECCCLFTGKTVEEITNNILSDCIDYKDNIQDQVRTLFKC